MRRLVSSSYVMSVRYVAGINHESRGRAAPEGRVIYSGNVPKTDMTLVIYVVMARVATDNGAKTLVCLDQNQFSDRFFSCWQVVTRSVSELTSRSSVLALVPSPSLAFSCSSPSLERSSRHPSRLTGSCNTHRKLI